MSAFMENFPCADDEERQRTMVEIELNRIALFERLGRLWTERVEGRNMIHAPRARPVLTTLSDCEGGV